jgi:hypothetical protein
MTVRFVSAAALACSGLGAVALGACSSGPDPAAAGRLAFMVGCWESTDAAGKTNREVWSLPSGGIMFGWATTITPGQPTFFEQTRIDLRDTAANYVASPNGDRPVIFQEARQAPAVDRKGNPLPATSITFENAQHDYPQRITYRAEKKGLSAAISRLDGSRPASYSWAPCKS